jgi:hypothetical protein
VLGSKPFRGLGRLGLLSLRVPHKVGIRYDQSYCDLKLKTLKSNHFIRNHGALISNDSLKQASNIESIVQRSTLTILKNYIHTGSAFNLKMESIEKKPLLQELKKLSINHLIH